jgi:CRP-like cAMP-binding protein
MVPFRQPAAIRMYDNVPTRGVASATLWLRSRIHPAGARPAHAARKREPTWPRMLNPRRHPSPNRLLESMPRRASQKILDRSEQVELHLGEVLHESGARIQSVYFPTGSFISLMVPLNGTAILEIAMVGDEGMVGLPLVSGVKVSPLRAVVQGEGTAWRMTAASFTRELAEGAAMRQGLQLYLQVRMNQLAQTAACTRFHVVEQRLARWLLMTQDRAHDDEFRVTHEFLAYMLGVRRVGVTKAAGALQARKLIRYHRGEMTILDRAGMEAASCCCYSSDRAIYDRLLAVRA